MILVENDKSLFLKPAVAINEIEAIWKNLQNHKNLGFLTLPQDSTEWSECERVAHEIQKAFQYMVVVGIGGSSLGAESLIKCLAPAGRNNVIFIDNYDLDEINLKLSNVLLDKCAFYIVSKSGRSLFTLSLTDLLINKLTQLKIPWRSAFWICTEQKDSTLYNWARQNQLPLLSIPLNVGGRFSVFTAAGLLPLAFADCNLTKIRQGALKVLDNPQALLTAAQFYFSCFQKQHSLSYIWFYSSMLKSFGPWLTQLWSESLGKVGSTASAPICCTGTIDQHSMLQQVSEGTYPKNVTFFHFDSLESSSVGPLGKSQFESAAYWQNKSIGEIMKAEFLGTQAALTERQIPLLSIRMQGQNQEDLGELVLFFESLIGLLGELLKINAFDQPGVELSKKNTKEILS